MVNDLELAFTLLIYILYIAMNYIKFALLTIYFKKNQKFDGGFLQLVLCFKTF